MKGDSRKGVCGAIPRAGPGKIFIGHGRNSGEAQFRRGGRSFVGPILPVGCRKKRRVKNQRGNPWGDHLFAGPPLGGAFGHLPARGGALASRSMGGKGALIGAETPGTSFPGRGKRFRLF